MFNVLFGYPAFTPVSSFCSLVDTIPEQPYFPLRVSFVRLYWQSLCLDLVYEAALGVSRDMLLPVSSS